MLIFLLRVKACCEKNNTIVIGFYFNNDSYVLLNYYRNDL